MNQTLAEKKFPSYFKNFQLPEWARDQELIVFRACPTGEVDAESFLNTYEENGFKVQEGYKETDPGQYSLSTYTKYKDVKRFMKMTSHYHVPFVIARGITRPVHGISLETSEWAKHLGRKYKSSHVDWWLYEGAQPHMEFEVYNNVETGTNIEENTRI